MGLPAIDIRRTGAPARPVRARLRLVAPRRPASRVRKRPGRARTCAQRKVFGVACVVITALALFGLGRVMLAAQATEASMRVAELRQDIKAERAVGERLEVDMSALTVPSRIESIAGKTMHMAQAATVEYMRMPPAPEPQPSVPAAVEETYENADPVPDPGPGAWAEAEDGFSAWLQSAMEMAAGEAHVMLVGDTGLASSD